MLAARWWRGVRREQRGVHARTASENLLRHSLGSINSSVGLPPHAQPTNCSTAEDLLMDSMSALLAPASTPGAVRSWRCDKGQHMLRRRTAMGALTALHRSGPFSVYRVPAKDRVSSPPVDPHGINRRAAF